MTQRSYPANEPLNAGDKITSINLLDDTSRCQGSCEGPQATRLPRESTAANTTLLGQDRVTVLGRRPSRRWDSDWIRSSADVFGDVRDEGDASDSIDYQNQVEPAFNSCSLGDEHPVGEASDLSSGTFLVGGPSAERTEWLEERKPEVWHCDIIAEREELCRLWEAYQIEEKDSLIIPNQVVWGYSRSGRIRLIIKGSCSEV